MPYFKWTTDRGTWLWFEGSTRRPNQFPERGQSMTWEAVRKLRDECNELLAKHASPEKHMVESELQIGDD